MSLLKLCDDLPSHVDPVAAATDTSDDPTAEADVQQLCEDTLAGVTEDLCRPLRSRVEQILLLEQAPLVLHRLASLVRFYTGTIKQVRIFVERTLLLH